MECYKDIMVKCKVNRQAQFAYSAGRIEAIKCGTSIRPTKIYRYDINSALCKGEN